MTHNGYDCGCASCVAVRQLWSAVAALEDPERLLLDNGAGELAVAERVKSVILAHGGSVSLLFDERLAMHKEAESVEEEIKRTMGRILGSGDPDVEIREVRTGADGVKRYEVTVKRQELTNGTTRETGGD